MKLQIFTENPEHPVVKKLEMLAKTAGMTAGINGGPNPFLNVKYAAQDEDMARVVWTFFSITTGVDTEVFTTWANANERKIVLLKDHWSEGTIAVNLLTTLLPAQPQEPTLPYRTTEDGFKTSDQNWTKGLNLV